jgi:hypothetical protein
MSDRTDPLQTSDPPGFAEQAGSKRLGVLSELLLFLRHNKKWWLTPIVLVLLLVGALVILGGTAAAPFIYTLF